MHPKSKVLSRDMDYFRYDQNSLQDRVFYIDNNKNLCKLIKTGLTREPLTTIRMYFPIFAKEYSDLFKIVSNGYYIRGTAYPQAERSKDKSMHMASRVFRQKLYKSDVYEVFPVWNCQVLWIEEIVSPTHSKMTETTENIVQYISNQIGGTINDQHLMTVILMACELVANYKNTSILHELNLYTKNLQF